ncbi:hypothetical protein FRC03_001070 [Tulasnella sp. 419]|nr:hypothetical protein FRC03_001070 [Tulasnella sp. 419]
MYQGFRSPHLSVDSHGAPRSSISTDFSETSSFLSSAASNLSSVVGEFSVLCLHDYQPTDPDQLGFRKGDILAILKTEDTGWWAAAMGSTIGWVPRGYVEPISDAMAETLKSVRRDLRANTADWDSASIAGPSTSSLRSSFSYSTGSSIARDTDWDPPRHTLPSGTDDVPSRSFAAGISSSHSSLTASTPPTHPSSPAQGYVFDPTSDPSGSRSPRITSRSHGYSNSTSSIPPRSRPVPIAGQQVETQRGILASPPSRKNSRADEDSLAFRNAQLAQAALPYYLKPTFRDGYICLEQDGTVKSGTLEALVERLTVDHLKRSHEQLFRMAFLMTYRTFTDAATVFDLLTERYLMDHPPELDEAQFAEWKEKKLRPTQIRVLTTLTEWVERYRFVKDERDMVDKLIEFLNLIKLPAANALTAKQLLEMIDKKISPVSSSTSIPQPTPSKKILGGGKKSKPHKNDITKIDPLELAQHLTLVEYRLYSQIRPSECMYWSKAQHGPQVENLNKFCATSDRLANWVKYSILSLDSLGKRADVVAQWIKIAEKCRGLNNLSSMTAIVAALSSIVITKLSVTWSHVGRSSHLENLRRLTDQSGNFAAFRNFYASVETSCVPYIGMSSDSPTFNTS